MSVFLYRSKIFKELKNNHSLEFVVLYGDEWYTSPRVGRNNPKVLVLDNGDVVVI